MLPLPPGYRLLQEMPQAIELAERNAQYWLDQAKVEGESLTPDLVTQSLTRPPSCPSKPPAGRGQRVVLATCSLLAGGAERVTVHLGIGLAKCGFDVTVLNVGASLGIHEPFRLALQRSGVEIAERLIDGSEGPFLRPGTVTVWWGHALLPRIKRGVEIPGSIYAAHSSGKWTADAIQQCQDGISYGVGVSGPASQMLQHVTGLKSSTIWNGIDPTPYQASKPKPRGREFVLGYLGRYSPEKNPIAAIAALQFLPSEIRLRCYGWGPLKQAMWEAAQEYGVADRVDLGGTVRDVAATLREFDALLIPSVYEGFPMTVIEAMHAGCPVITGPHGDLALVNKEGERGILIKPEPFSIAGGTMRLFDDPDKAKRIALAGQNFAREHLTVEKMAWAYGRLINRVARAERN